MGKFYTVGVATNNPYLIELIKKSINELSVIEINPKVAMKRIDGRLWCIVDNLFPLMSGGEICRQIRLAAVTAHAHITMILDENSIESRRKALIAGADDYLVGPITREMLVKRASQLNAGSLTKTALPTLKLGDLMLDLVAGNVSYRGRSIALAPNDFQLLTHFLQHPDRVISSTNLITLLGKNFGERTCGAAVGRLRRALIKQGVPNPLRTVRTLGFVLDSSALQPTS